MNALLAVITAMKMQVVRIQMVHTLARVIMVTMEMVSVVKVSVYKSFFCKTMQDVVMR